MEQFPVRQRPGAPGRNFNEANGDRTLAYNVLAIACSEIGSNRQNRANRFPTVVQYSLDMSLALLEIARITRPAALSILVVGREFVSSLPDHIDRMLGDAPGSEQDVLGRDWF